MHNIDRTLLEFDPESEYYESAEGEEEYAAETIGVFNEDEENELAAELLAVTKEDELDQFLGGLIRRAGKAIGGFVRSPTGQQLGGILKGAAKQALPILGSAVGGHFGGAKGAQFGSRVATAAGNLFGLETEGLSAEDREYEVARRFVRFAGAAVQNATAASGQPAQTPQQAVAAAAQQHAPGLLSRGVAGVQKGSERTGRWIRRGSRIVLMGV